jgi:regulator of replication initiation timing
MIRVVIFSSDYMASIDEETKNAIRKLEAEKRELKIENENLKKKVGESEKLGKKLLKKIEMI